MGRLPRRPNFVAPHAGSLAERRLSSPESQEPPRHPGGRGTSEAKARLAGLLLVAAGLILMWQSFAEALAATVRGTGGGDELRGASLQEEISGLGGADELYGGPGGDVLLAGEGDDFVEATDGELDFVLCGPGDDTASVDRADLVAHDCETVHAG